MTYLNRDSAQKILNTRPAGTSVQDALKTLSDKGFTIEGYNDGSKGSINEPSTLQKIGGAIKNVATGIKEGVVNAANNINDINNQVYAKGSQEYQKYKAGEQSMGAGIVKSIGGSAQGTLQEGGEIANATVNTPVMEAFGGAFNIADAVAQGKLSQAGQEILATAPVQQLLQSAQSGDGLISIDKYNAWKAENPVMAKNLEAVINIASIVPAVQGVKDVVLGTKAVVGATKEVLGTVIKDTSAAFSKIPRATDKLATIAKESINPTVSKEKAIGEVLQGTTKDIKKASEGLNLIDTTGIKTYKELDNTINDKISTLARTVDNEFAQDTTKTILDNLTITKPTKAGGSVSVNYVDNALKQLEELYNKTGDIVSETDIRDLRNLAQTQGLTKLEINDIARTYGQEFGEKAFGKIGEPLTSVNAQLYENTRKGIKEVARNGLSSDAAKQADQAMSSLYNTRVLVKKNVEAVNKLMNRIEERGLVEKIGHSVSKYADILTGGGLRGFVGGLLPRGAGYKTLNALDLENLLERNLKIIQQASQAKTAAEVKTITSKLFTK